jgi:hypothetical protein
LLVGVGGASGRLPERVDAPVRASHVGDLAVGRTDAPFGFGRDRDDIPRNDPFGRARIERHVIRATARSLDDGIEATLQFVRQALAGDTTVDDLLPALRVRRQGLSRADDVVARWVTGNSSVNLLEDVAPRAEVAQVLLPALGEPPCRGGETLGESQPLKRLKTGEQDGRVDDGRSGGVADRDLVVLGASLELAVERSESLLCDLLGAGALDVDERAQPQLLGR